MSILKSEKELFIEVIKNNFYECESIRPDLVPNIKEIMIPYFENGNLSPSLDIMKSIIARHFYDPSAFDTGACSKLFMDSVEKCSIGYADSHSEDSVGSPDFNYEAPAGNDEL